ncbi:MAG: galactokinase family protein, partial [Lysobacterales bacterium]
MTQLPAKEFISSEFSRLYGAQPVLFRAPGRINIIGEHTDYNDGLVLPATVDLYTWAAASPRDDRILRTTFQDHAEPVEIRLDCIEAGEKGQPAEYLKAVAWALGEEGVELAGCDLLIGGNLPIGGGLSSSASLELVVAWALLECAGLRMERKAIAQVCRRAEAQFVGMQCGIMDQYAIALGERGCAMLLDCRQLEFEQVRLPPGACFLVTHSGVSHRLASGGYNTRRQECEEAVGRLEGALPDLESLRDLDLRGLERQEALLGDRLYRRCRHVISENLRVLEARDALAEADFAMLGALL